MWETAWGKSLSYIAAFLAAFVIYYFIDRENKNIRLKIYLTASFYVVRWLTLGIAVRVNVLLDSITSKIFTETLDYSYPDKVYRIFLAEYVVNSIIEVTVYAFIQWYFVKKLTDIYKNKDKELTNRELVILLTPAFIGGMSYLLNMMYSYKYSETDSMLLFGIKGAGIIWIIYLLILFASILITAGFYQQIQEKQIIEARELMLQNSVRDIQTHINEIENIYSQVRGIKHDINNHVGVLAGLIEQGNNAEAIEYMKSFQDIADMSDLPVKTGNPVTDVIINEKMKEAENKGMKFQSDFHYPKDTSLNAFDISIILSNALSNAVEAAGMFGIDGIAEKDKVISISSFRKKNVYMIIVTNPFNGILDINGETGLPRSTKDDNSEHGIGLNNIKMVADKYFGDARLERKDSTVTLTVMLKI